MINGRVLFIGLVCVSWIITSEMVFAMLTTNSTSLGSFTISTQGQLPNTPLKISTTLVAIADSELYEHSPEKNMGAKRQLNVISRAGWNARVLLQFDLSSIPATATIQSCQLRLFLSEASTFGSRDHGIFRLVAHSDEWGEGTHRFSSGTVGESSWRWFVKPADWSTLGGDMATQPTAIATTGSTDQTWLTWNLMPDCLAGVKQSWVVKDMNEGNPNYTIRTEYQSRESFYTDQQPHLNITYQLPSSS